MSDSALDNFNSLYYIDLSPSHAQLCRARGAFALRSLCARTRASEASLHRDALRQVARLIYVQPSDARQVV